MNRLLKQDSYPNSSGIDVHGPLDFGSSTAHVRSGFVSARVLIIIMNSSRGLSPNLDLGDHSIERKISNAFPDVSLKTKPHNESAAEIDDAGDGMGLP